MANLDSPDDDRAPPDGSGEFRRAGAHFLRYVADNPLGAIAGALIVSTILVRFAFLGNPKD